MNTDSYQVISAQLESGEKLLWNGVPRQGIFLKSSDFYFIPFSLMWGGFAIFWEFMVIFLPGHAKNGNSPGQFRWFMPLWGIPFVCIGLYLIFGRFFVDAKQRAKTFYGVTNKRVIIISGLVTSQIRSLYPQNLGEISISEMQDGSGTILFGSQLPFPYGMRNASWPGMNANAVPCFDSIPKAKEVLKIIQQELQNRS